MLGRALRRGGAALAWVYRRMARSMLWCLGWRSEEEIGSNTREATSRACIFSAAGLLLLIGLRQLAPSPAEWPELVVLVITVMLALVQFFYCICIVFYLGTKDGGDDPFHPRPLRLIRDIVFSSFAWIVACAALYGQFDGVHPTSSLVSEPAALELAYFSVVVFTTLGFGDLIPTTPLTRLLATAEALLGNIHLGLLAGAFFYALAYNPLEATSPNSGRGSPASTEDSPA